MIKKILLGLASSITIFTGFSQNTCLGTDLTICTGDQVTLEVCGGGGGLPNSIGTVTPINLNVDDGYSGVIPIGFDFEFYGNTYNQLVVSSNMYLTFDVSNANGYSPWSINNPIPNPANPLNAIMYPWQDINPSASTNDFIGYKTVGTAPNRKFYLVYKNIEMFNDPTEACSGVILYEGSNRIETILDEKPLNAGWNGGAAIHGLHDATGTLADVVPGRNFPTQWTANLDAWEFIPNGTNAYTINQIPYDAIIVDNVDYTWGDTEGNSYSNTGNTLTVTPTPVAPSDSIGYFVNYSSCAVSGLQTSDTSWITVNSVNVAVNGTDDFCTQGNGEATAIANGGSSPYTYQWNDPNNQTGATATGLFQGTYTVTVTDAIGCQGTANVTIGDTPISLSTNYTQVSCPGGNDGTATVTITPTPTTATYDWYDAGGQTTQTATGLSAGTYNVAIETGVGCQDTAQVTVDEIPGMLINLVSSTDASCNSGSDGQATVEVTQGTAPYSYSWTGSSSTTETANDLAAGTHTVTVTDDNGCVITMDVTIGEPSPLQLDVIAPDTTVCVGDSALLYATGSGGSSPYTFTWKQNGNVVGVGDTISVLPQADNSQYCVTLTEQCGSPQTQECMIVSYPDDIVPLISPDTTGACHPVEVTFDNVTNTSQSIDYTVWDYGDGDIDTINGLDPATHEFDEGLFDINVEIVSQLGCNYFATFDDLIEGYPYPDAKFYVNPNPASVYEPEVDAFSQSGSDIISYKWIAEGANPEHSSLQNPTFEYADEVENYDLILVVENGHGCKDTMERIVRIQNEVQIFAPNSFTPDGDELNQNWRVFIEGIDVFNFDMFIFNRWGEIVWESHDPDASWDGTYGGKEVPEGTYIWKIRAYDAENDNKYEFKGFVNVIR